MRGGATQDKKCCYCNSVRSHSEESHLNIRNWLYHPDVIADPKYKDRIASAVEFWDLTNKEDWGVCEQMQQGTASQRFDRGTYAGQEDMLYALDQELLRVLGHDETLF